MSKTNNQLKGSTRKFNEKAGWGSLWNMLLLLSGILMIVNLYLIFLWVPTRVDYHQLLGVYHFDYSQKVLYVHVSLAWVGFLGFFIVLIGSAVYLWKKSVKWDALAHSAAEIGVLCTSLVLITGMIWAKSQWGTWWKWEPRLTTTLILWLIYVAYLMVRAYATKPSQGARYAAVLGIIGFIDVPIVYYAVKLWRGQHPGQVIGPGSESNSLETSMLVTFMFSLVTFTVLFVSVLWSRYSLRRAEDNLKREKLSLSTSGIQ